jgi:membrane protease YdiL (CAAX protease family)
MTKPPQPAKRLWEFVAEPLRRANEETRVYLASPASQGVDGKTVAVLLTAALALSMQYYLCRVDEARAATGLLDQIGLSGAAEWARARLDRLTPGGIDRWTYWALVCFLSYTILPALLIRLVFRERLADYGVKLRGAFTDGWVYLVMLVVVGPLVWVASHNPQFQEHYPFYQLPRGDPLWPNFWRWELVYGLQFVGVEFFFRGFLVYGLKRRFGAYAIVVMTVPYCMIHFGKPLPETLAAIFAGLALGFMSLRTRSIVLGVAIHMTVALSMDFASMWQKGWFG